MNLEFFISRRKLTRKGFGPTVVDAAGVDTFTIDFDEEWDGLVKLVELKNGDACAQVYYGGRTPLPRQVCGRGTLYLTCYGYRKKDDNTAVIRTVPMVRPVQLAGSLMASGGNDLPIVPNLLEQLTAKAAQAERAAKEAENAVSELMALKDAGAFAATVQVLSVEQGEPAHVENVGTDTHAVLRFILPYRLNEEEKQVMAEQIKTDAIGEIGVALDNILAVQEDYISRALAEEAVE